MNIPTAKQLKSIRESHGLTQAQAAELVHMTVKAWQALEQNYRKIRPLVWAHFQYKLNRKHWGNHWIVSKDVDDATK